MITTRNSMTARIQNAFSKVRRDRRGNVWVEYLILVAVLGLAGIKAFDALKGQVEAAAGKAGEGIVKMEAYKK
jgi:Flp pilus assembly pilin Flp